MRKYTNLRDSSTFLLVWSCLPKRQSRAFENNIEYFRRKKRRLLGSIRHKLAQSHVGFHFFTLDPLDKVCQEQHLALVMFALEV
jgi:hypothetical protein